MSDEKETANQVDQLMQPFADFWKTYLQHAPDGTRQLLESFDDSVGSQELNRQWLDAVSQAMEAYMRSPAFLQTLKHNVDTMIKTKQQLNELGKDFAENIGIASSAALAELSRRLDSVEQSVLSKIDELESRLAVVEKKLDRHHDAARHRP